MVAADVVDPRQRAGHQQAIAAAREHRQRIEQHVLRRRCHRHAVGGHKQPLGGNDDVAALCMRLAERFEAVEADADVGHRNLRPVA